MLDDVYVNNLQTSDVGKDYFSITHPEDEIPADFLRDFAERIAENYGQISAILDIISHGPTASIVADCNSKLGPLIQKKVTLTLMLRSFRAANITSRYAKFDETCVA